MQGTLLQSSQYGKVNYPIKKTETLNPLMASYKTKDERVRSAGSAGVQHLYAQVCKGYGA